MRISDSTPQPTRRFSTRPIAGTPQKASSKEQLAPDTVSLGLDLAKTVKHYVKPALIAAAPALATTLALTMGGVPAAGIAILGSGLIGGVAGASTWGSEIGHVRAAIGGSIASMVGGTLGLVGGALGAVTSAAIGLGREAIFRHLPRHVV